MTKIILAVLAVVAIQIAVVSAHGWLNIPRPASYVDDSQASASNESPCGKGIGPAVNVQKFTSLQTDFTAGGGHDDGTCYFSLATRANATDFAAPGATFYSLPCPSGNNFDREIFITHNPGTYYMQWVWDYGTRWYACVPLTVTAAPITSSSLSVGQSTSGDFTANTNRYWDVTVPANNFVLIEVNGPNGAVFGASTNAIPEAGSADVTINGAGTVTLCSSSSTTTTAIIGAFPGSNTGSYSLSTSTYDGLVQFAKDGSGDVYGSLSAGSNRIYATEAFDTSSAPKRFVARRSSGEGGLAVKAYGTSCALSTAPTTFSSVACVAVGTNQQRKFYGVYADSGADYTVSVEPGTCNQLNSSVSVQASFLLVLAALLSIMF